MPILPTKAAAGKFHDYMDVDGEDQLSLRGSDRVPGLTRFKLARGELARVSAVAAAVVHSSLTPCHASRAPRAAATSRAFRSV